MVKMLLVLMVITLTGCAKQYTENSESYRMPPPLANCKVYNLESGNLSRDITVVHCPHADTTTSYSESCGKNCTRPVNTTIVSE